MSEWETLDVNNYTQVGERRGLKQPDVDSFIRAATEGDIDRSMPTFTATPNPQQFFQLMVKRAPFRMKRLGKDLDWLRKQAEKNGLSREEIRWLL